MSSTFKNPKGNGWAKCNATQTEITNFSKPKSSTSSPSSSPSVPKAKPTPPPPSSSSSQTPPPVAPRRGPPLKADTPPSPSSSSPSSSSPSSPPVNSEFSKFTSFGNAGGNNNNNNNNNTNAQMADKAILELGLKSFLSEAEFLENKKDVKFTFFRKNSGLKGRGSPIPIPVLPEQKFKGTKRKEFLKYLKAYDGSFCERKDLALEKKPIEWLIKTLKKKGQEEENILIAAQWLSCHSYPEKKRLTKEKVERTPGMRKKILTSGVIKEIFKLARERKVYVHTPIDPKEIILEKQIGKGSGGKIFSANWQGNIIAVKMCSESNIFYSSSEEFHFELAITSILDHPNILPCLGGNTNVSECFLAMPLCKMGSLEEILRPMDESQKVMLDWNAKILITSKICAAMTYIHSLGILHRDLKTSNVLVGNDFDEVYLIDFGISRVLSSRMTLNVGTTAMIAPELLEGNGKYSEKADVYSFSIMLWEIVSQRRPYEEIGSWEIPGKVMDGYRPTIPKDCLDILEDIIIACWDQNPSKRPSFQDVTDMIEKYKLTSL